EQPHPQVPGEAQRRRVADQFLAIAAHDARQGQGADAGRRQEEVEAAEHTEAQRRARQEPARDAQQADAREHRRQQQADGRGDGPPVAGEYLPGAVAAHLRRSGGTDAITPAGSRNTRPAQAITGRLCVATTTILPGAKASSAASRSPSVAASRKAVGSSSSNISGSRSSARASATRRASPPDSPRPRAPTGVSSPSGSRLAKRQTWAASAAACTAASVASGSPRRMLSASVPRKIQGRCVARAMRAPGGRSRRPSTGGSQPASASSRLLLPDPLAPTRASRSPCASANDRPDSTGTAAPG